MSLPSYPAYRETSVPWLGEVPVHWKSEKLKYVSRAVGGGTPSREILDYWDGDIPWVSPKDMKSEFLEDAQEKITLLGLENSTAGYVPAGWVLMVVRSGILKHSLPVAINKIPVALNQDLKALCFDKGEIMPIFFLRWIQGLEQSLLLSWASQGVTVESVDQYRLHQTVIAIPPAEEQRAITDFLDFETSKIDALIAEQQRLIELLKEKRQAVINHAVTKGLDPDVPMKPSGIEWIGDIPAHWELVELRRLAKPETSITYGIVQAGPDVEGGVPYIRTSDMAGEYLPESGYLRTSEEIDKAYSRSRVAAGDLVVAIRATLGKALAVPDFLRGANLTQGTAKISPGERLISQYLYWTFNADYCQISVDAVAKGATFREITLHALRRIKILVPPLEEQKMLIRYLEEQNDRLSALRNEAEKAVSILQERRSALISAAVTGKIDVREHVLEEAV